MFTDSDTLDALIRQLVDERLADVLPDVIADNLRLARSRPARSSGVPTKLTGTVADVGTTTAEVQLDDDEPGILATVQLGAAVSIGDRVVILHDPAGGAVIVGNGSTVETGGIPAGSFLPLAGGTMTGDITLAEGGIAHRQVFNVKDYGAVGDGVTDDSAAIQAAVADATAAGGGVVWFPPGGSGFAHASTILLSGPHVVLASVTAFATHLKPLAPMPDGQVHITANDCAVRNLGFQPASTNYALNPAADCIRVESANGGASVARTRIENCSGFYHNGWFINVRPYQGDPVNVPPNITYIRECDSRGGRGGLRLQGGGGSLSIGAQVVSCYFGSALDEGYRLEHCHDVEMVSCQGGSVGAGVAALLLHGNVAACFFSSCAWGCNQQAGSAALRVESGAVGPTTYSPYNCHFGQCIFEAAEVGASIGGATTDGINFANCNFTLNTGSGVEVINGFAASFLNCGFNDNNSGATASYAASVLADAPLAFWRLAEAAGTVAADASGNAHPGTYTPGTGTITLGQTSPISSDLADKSIVLAPGGTGDRYVISAPSTAWDTASMTLEAWIKPTSGQAAKHGIASLMPAGGFSARWYVRIHPATGDVEILHAGATLLGVASVSFDVWTHLVVTFDAADSKYRIYKNGVLAGTSAASSLGPDTNTPLTVGHNNASGAGGEEFVGGIDEVAVYGTALTLARIAAHYAAAVTPASVAYDLDVQSTTQVWETLCKFSSTAVTAATSQPVGNVVRQIGCSNNTGKPLFVGTAPKHRFMPLGSGSFEPYIMAAADVPPIPEAGVTNLVPDLAALQAAVGVKGLALYGDGSDGTVTFDGAATVLGLVPAGGVYTMTRDLYLADGSALTGTAVLQTAGFRLFWRGTLTTGASTFIRNNGANGAAGVGGAGAPGGFFAAGVAGANGGVGANGATPANITNAIGRGGGASGASSGGPGTGGGRPISTVTSPTGAAGLPRNIAQALSGAAGFAPALAGAAALFVGGNGGAGGDAAAASTGGGGGGGGGVLGMYGQKLINNGQIRARGGDGAAGSGAGTGAGGGGGGGGGAVILVCDSITGNAPSAPAGNGGAAQGAGKAGATGSAGQVFTLLNI